MPLATILIEDSPAIRSGLIPALAELGDVEVIATAETADQGIAALKAHADKVIDIDLPPLNLLPPTHAQMSSKNKGSRVTI